MASKEVPKPWLCLLEQSLNLTSCSVLEFREHNIKTAVTLMIKILLVPWAMPLNVFYSLTSQDLMRIQRHIDLVSPWAPFFHKCAKSISFCLVVLTSSTNACICSPVPFIVSQTTLVYGLSMMTVCFQNLEVLFLFHWKSVCDSILIFAITSLENQAALPNTA